MNTSTEQLVPFEYVSKMLSRSRNGLYLLMKNDSAFPKPIKFGETRQAPVYFRLEEINSWFMNKLQSRGVQK